MKWNYFKIIIIGLTLLLILIVLKVGYLNKYNTYINIASYFDDLKPHDIEVIIDNKLVVKDIVDTIEYGFFGKIHPVKIYPGRHKIVAKSKKLNLIDSINFYSIWYSHFYIEMGEDMITEEAGIGIDKRFGRTIVFE